MRRHKKEFNLLRGKKNVIQDLLCSLNVTEILKGQLYSHSQRLLDKETSRQQIEIFLTPFIYGTILLSEAHVAHWKRSTSCFCMWIRFMHKYSPILLFSHLPRHKKVLN